VLVLNFSQVTGNTSNGGPADGAGGIANAGTATINASQVNGNTAPGNPLTLKLSVVTGNTASRGGGIYAVTGSPVTLKLTLVFRNVRDNCFPPGSIPGCKN
jgi:hypothetical protein